MTLDWDTHMIQWIVLLGYLIHDNDRSKRSTPLPSKHSTPSKQVFPEFSVSGPKHRVKTVKNRHPQTRSVTKTDSYCRWYDPITLIKSIIYRSWTVSQTGIPCQLFTYDREDDDDDTYYHYYFSTSLRVYDDILKTPRCLVYPFVTKEGSRNPSVVSSLLPSDFLQVWTVRTETVQRYQWVI